VSVICSRTGLPLTQHFKFDNWPEVCGNCENPESYIYECIRQVEFHEVGEWLIIDGQRPYDPHDPECYIRNGYTPPEDAKATGGTIDKYGVGHIFGRKRRRP
jgi:hypothetical protein